jgi:hypothetical protein
MNTLEPLYTVSLTKLTFVLWFIVHNCKNSNIRIFIYNYLHLLMFIWTTTRLSMSRDCQGSYEFLIVSIGFLF